MNEFTAGSGLKHFYYRYEFAKFYVSVSISFVLTIRYGIGLPPQRKKKHDVIDYKNMMISCILSDDPASFGGKMKYSFPVLTFTHVRY